MKKLSHKKIDDELTRFFYRNILGGGAYNADGTGDMLIKTMDGRLITLSRSGEKYFSNSEKGVDRLFFLFSLFGSELGLLSKMYAVQNAGAELSSITESWLNSDGTPNYPPNNGAVIGSEKITSLKTGKTIGRYGNIGPSSNFVTQTGASASKLSLPPWTDSNIYSEFKILKDIPNVKQSIVAPWGGSSGGGIQYQLPMPINELIKQGYLEKIVE